MITWLTDKHLSLPVRANPGDTVSLEFLGEDGRQEKLVYDVTDLQIINYFAIGQFTDEFDCNSGYIGIFANKEK
jgi:hypothetical protein